MNHLAHCFLSFGHEDWLVGNFIGDYVKGNDWANYAPGVQSGIKLHRTIDAFTDASPLVHRCAARIRPFSKRFSGPVNDILFDHLLTIHWDKFAAQSMHDFAQQTYTMLHNRRAEMPDAMQRRLPNMIGGNFLMGYGQRAGLDFVFGKFMGRLSQPFDQDAMLDFFMDNRADFEADFLEFFPQLLEKARAFVQDK
jgi:acyl carrier protein phosphodiesterase